MESFEKSQNEFSSPSKQQKLPSLIQLETQCRARDDEKQVPLLPGDPQTIEMSEKNLANGAKFLFDQVILMSNDPEASVVRGHV